jgi:hypothetical protein
MTVSRDRTQNSVTAAGALPVERPPEMHIKYRPLNWGWKALAGLAIIAIGILPCVSGPTLAQGPRQANDYTALVQQICEQYAAAVTGMPSDLMFKQCMSERHCSMSPGSAGYQCQLPGPMTWHGGGY